MSFLGDLAFVIGTLGVIVYLCLIIIRYTSQASQLKTAIQRYESQIARLQQRLGELQEKREAIDPEVDTLVDQVVEQRAIRDRLHFRYEDMVARSRQREIHIKYDPR